MVFTHGNEGNTLPKYLSWWGHTASPQPVRRGQTEGHWISPYLTPSLSAPRMAGLCPGTQRHPETGVGATSAWSPASGDPASLLTRLQLGPPEGAAGAPAPLP